MLGNRKYMEKQEKGKKAKKQEIGNAMIKRRIKEKENKKISVK